MTRRFGLRPVIAAGAVISSTGIILASFTKELWQLYLAQVKKKVEISSSIKLEAFFFFPHCNLCNPPTQKKKNTFSFQGVLFGLGAGMSIFTSIAIPVQWFNKRRGLASGITVAGSGVGGAALAPLNRFLISKVGFRWALRVMGMSFVVIILSVLVCIRTRIPIGRRGGPIFDFSLFREPGFVTMYFMVSH